jgi:hypothetical protein
MAYPPRQWEYRADLEASSRVRAGVEAAADGRDPLTHPRDAMTYPILAGHGAAPLVFDLDVKCRGLEPEPDPHEGVTGVLADVGERFLDHPVGGQVHDRWEWTCGSVGLVHDPKSGPSKRGEEVLEASHPDGGFGGVGGVGWLAGLAEQAYGAA